MIASIYSYLQYYKYFWLRFVRDGGWGREAVGGFLIALAILFMQIRMGVLRPGDLNAEFWSIAFPYAILLGAWFVFHFSVTAWRLDRERGDREGPPLRLVPHSTRSGNRLSVSVQNLGPTDDFTAEIIGVQGWERDTYPELPEPARWVNEHGNTRAGTVTIPEGRWGYIQLAQLPGPKAHAEPVLPSIVIYTAANDYEAQLRWKNESTLLIERVVISVAIQANGTGRRTEAAFVIAASYGSKYLYSEVYRYDGQHSGYPLPASTDP